jgi:hypothetical protein
MRPHDREIQAALDAYDAEQGGNAKLDGGRYRIGLTIYAPEDARKLAETHLILGLPIRPEITVDFAHELALRLDRLEEAVRQHERELDGGGATDI